MIFGTLTLEEYILGCVINSKEARRKIFDIPEQAFTTPQYRTIFRVVRDLYLEHANFDVIDLMPKLEPALQEETMRIAVDTITAVLFDDYLKEFLEEYRKRRVKELLQKALEDGQYNASELVRQLTLIQTDEQVEVSTVKDIVVELYDYLEAKQMKPVGQPTGYSKLDELLGGLIGGCMYVIAARPAMGKTTFVTNLATNILNKDGVVLFISCEMPKVMIAQKIVSRIGKVNAERLRDGRLDDEEWKKVTNGFAWLGQRKLYILDRNITLERVVSAVRYIKTKEGRVDAVIIDYLQLLELEESKHMRGLYEQVTYISRALKTLAQDEKVPVITLSQLSRSCEAREDKRPILSDLRDSGYIEQDADVVAFLYRDSYYWTEEEKEGRTKDEWALTELIVAKNRYGQTGTVYLSWLPEFQLFTEVRT